MADASGHGPQAALYFNGHVVPADAARPAPDDHGLMYGLGFFETFRTSGGRPHLWPWHRRRLQSACAIAGIELPGAFLAGDEARLAASVRSELERHGVADGVFRYTVTAGRPSSGLGATRYDEPSEWLAFRPLPEPAGPGGAILRVLALGRDSGEWLPRPKSLNFANALLGDHELRRRGAAPTDEGLFLGRDGGHVVEAIRHNVMWIDGGRFGFPDPQLGAVAGTCLQWLLDCGLEAEPRRIRLGELLRAEAIVLLNAVRGVTPVRAVWDADDRAQLGAWESRAHPQVIRLCAKWSDALRATAGL